MTAQIPECLLYQGEELSMCSEPLGDYFAMSGLEPRFGVVCTALWRGYTGDWEIVDERLYLVGLQGSLEDGTEASVATFFPEFPDRVFAHWFSGTIRVPQGKMLEYLHHGYGSTYERDLLLELDHGVVTSTTVRHNGTSEDDDAPEGYEVAAMIVSQRSQQE